jgi:hypothetical protein
VAALPRTERPLTARRFSADALERLKQQGFEVTTVGSDPERIRVLKHDCAALFERQAGSAGEGAGGELRLAQAPGYVFRGEIGRLWDAGYQKFWLLGPVTDEPFNEPRRPALAEQMKELQQFDNELKYALGIPSFYNESIGTTNEISAYDRVRGRGPSTRQQFS